MTRHIDTKKLRHRIHEDGLKIEKIGKTPQANGPLANVWIGSQTYVVDHP
jgi:hypothetical protein